MLTGSSLKNNDYINLFNPKQNIPKVCPFFNVFPRFFSVSTKENALCYV